MPPPPHTKPENVHKRAQELIGVGQSLAALNLLHEHLTSKRTRNNPIASLEPVMLLFIELCVDLRKGKQAKDGCYSYKNTAQNTNVGTIELVLKKFIELSEAKVKEAQEKAEQVQTSLESQTAASTIDDLEASETPESILLSTVSGEQSKDRTDRAIVTPWLKFLWETYRTVLDILKNNARLEVMYQSTAYQAFEFCQKYTRKTEFRRLCELLRNHLQSAAKYQQQIHSINLSDPDTLQRHLDTRFQQLNVAVELELWQEAFRSIEDIHTLLNLSKRPAKNVMMANYFEKLSTIFLVSENYLFHAAAYNRLFGLLRASAAAVASGQSAKKDNPTVSDADITQCASFSILSALAIPVISTSRSRGALVDVDEARKNKNQRLTNLLGLGTAPSRASLFREIQNKGLLKRARPEIRDLYNILEVDFHPLSICRKISPILTQIGADQEMGKYVAPLQQVILTRLFQQLSQVYESVELKYVLSLAQFPEPFQVSKSTIEKFIMNGCKKGDLAIRIDHASGVLTFDSDVFSSAKALHPGSGAGSAESEVGSVQRLQSTPAEIVRSQLSRLAKTLFVTCNYVDPTFAENARRDRAAALARAEQNANKEHMEILERRQIIEKRKQTASAVAAAKEKEEATRKRIRAQQQQEAEQQRLAEEQRRRDQQKMQAEQARVQREELQKQVNELKQGVRGFDIDIDTLDLDQIDATKLRQMKISALEREKMDLTRRLNTTLKKLDHLERAYRLEEAKKLPADFEAQVARDKTEYEETTEQTLREAKEKHDYDVALKHRLARLVPSYETFRDRIQRERAEVFERRRRAAQKELEAQKQKRIKDHKERKARELREREERERREREEEEQREREEAERAAAEEEKKRVQAEQRAKREEERKRDQEKIQQQLQREEEAAARRATGRAGAPTPAPAPAASAAPTPSADGARRPLFAGKTGGGWREREAARAASGGANGPAPAAAASEAPAPAPAPAAAPASRQGGGYVPPHLRGAASSGEKPDSAAPPSGGRFMPPSAREGGSRWQRPSERPNGERSDSPAAANGAEAPPPAAAGAGGKYRPGAFRRGPAGGA